MRVGSNCDVYEESRKEKRGKIALLLFSIDLFQFSYIFDFDIFCVLDDHVQYIGLMFFILLVICFIHINEYLSQTQKY